MWGLVIWSALLTGCGGIKDYIPQGPVMGMQERLAEFSGQRPPEVTYQGPPRVAVPVVPLQVFGVTYDLDLVIRTTHPDWDMHEYARITTPDGPLWLAKDARAPEKTQSIVADVPDIAAWLPEVPVERQRGTVEVTDRSSSEWLDLEIRYTNLDGQPVEVTYEGKVPDTPQKLRNGSTFGHSRDTLAPVLDVSHRAFGKRATVTIGGERQKLVKALGLVPIKVVLAQTQGGFAAGAWDVEPMEDGVLTVHPGIAAQAWDVVQGEGWVELVQRAPLRTITYRFLEADDALSLVSARVRPFAAPTDAVHVSFQPGLPDLRRPFSGTVEGRWVIDVGGQLGHGVGTWSTRWVGEEAQLSLRGDAPDWLVDRPLDVAVTYADGKAHVNVVRTAFGE